MRLIDADYITEQLTSGWFLDILLTQTSKEELQEKLCNLVDSVPIAFDVDNVLEDLEMTADAANDEIMARAGCEQYYDGYEDGVCAAIEIIKEEGEA